jgi:hypothetical protein
MVKVLTTVPMSLLITFIFEFTMKENSKKLTLNSLEKSLDGNQSIQFDVIKWRDYLHLINLEKKKKWTFIKLQLQITSKISEENPKHLPLRLTNGFF